MQKKYVIGLDYGTLSGRAVIVDCENGKVLAASVKNSAYTAFMSANMFISFMKLNDFRTHLNTQFSI